jgi:DNA replication protein DnaC
MNVHLQRMLKELRLSGLAQSLEVRLQEAAGHSLSHSEFLELVLEDELLVRQSRAIDRRLTQANLQEMKTLEQFDFSFNPGLPKRRIHDLATGAFLRDARDVLLLGPPGTGKTHLCQSIGRSVIKAGFTVLYRSIFDIVRDFLHEQAFQSDDKILARYLKPDLLIVDDMGMKQLPKRSGECLFEVILRRHEVRSTMMTSNRPLVDWGKLIGDVPAATAILDRFLEHAELIEMKGKSYRLRNRSEASDNYLEKESTEEVKTDQSAHRVEDTSSTAESSPAGNEEKVSGKKTREADPKN